MQVICTTKLLQQADSHLKMAMTQPALQADEEALYSSVSRNAPAGARMPGKQGAEAFRRAHAGLGASQPINNRATLENGSMGGRGAWANAGASVAAISGRSASISRQKWPLLLHEPPLFSADATDLICI